MKTNKKGEPIKYFADDTGIHEVTEQDDQWHDPDAPVFEDPVDACRVAIRSLSSRVEDLESTVQKLANAGRRF